MKNETSLDKEQSIANLQAVFRVTGMFEIHNNRFEIRYSISVL